MRDGRPVHIRALHPQDRDAILAAVARTGKQSLSRRFFGARREFSEDAGLRELFAEVLPENTPMLKVMEKSALPMTTKQDSGVVHVSLTLV